MTSNPASRVDNRALPLGLLVAVCLLGFALRLYALSTDSLWADEISTVTRSLLDLRSLLWALRSFGVCVELPVIYIVTRLFILLFGESELIPRMPAVIFRAFSVLLVCNSCALPWTRERGRVDWRTVCRFRL